MKLGQYVEKNSWFHRLDGRSKIIFLISLTLMSFILDNIMINLLILLIIVSLSFSAKIGKKFLKSLGKFAGLIVFAGFVWILFYRASLFQANKCGVELFRIGPIIVDSTGLYYGVKMPLRIIIMVSIPSLFFMTTTIREFIISLSKMGIPYIVSFTFGLAAQLIFSLSNEYEKIKNAQIARGLEVDSGNLFKRIRNHIPILIPFTVRSIELADEINLAISLKNFNPSIRNRKFYGDKKMSFIDYLLISLSFLILLLSIIVRLGVFHELPKIYF